MRSLQEPPSLPCWDFDTEQPGGSHSRGPEALKIVSAGHTEGHFLILCIMNTYTNKRYLDPKQVYKESLLFSDRCLISLVVLLISSCNARALKFLGNEFPPDLCPGEDRSPHEVLPPKAVAWASASCRVLPGGAARCPGLPRQSQLSCSSDALCCLPAESRVWKIMAKVWPISLSISAFSSHVTLGREMHGFPEAGGWVGEHRALRAHFKQ